jgi:hypothetical protein
VWQTAKAADDQDVFIDQAAEGLAQREMGRWLQIRQERKLDGGDVSVRIHHVERHEYPMIKAALRIDAGRQVTCV